MQSEIHRRPIDRGARARRKSVGRHPAPAAKPPAGPFPYVIRKASPGLPQPLRVERGEPVRSLRLRLQRLADEWAAELCLVLSERQTIYFAPGKPQRDSDRLPRGPVWEKPAG